MSAEQISTYLSAVYEYLLATLLCPFHNRTESFFNFQSISCFVHPFIYSPDVDANVLLMQKSFDSVSACSSVILLSGRVLFSLTRLLLCYLIS
jgi:hypothetical protein